MKFSNIKDAASNAYLRAGVATATLLGPALAFAQATDPFDAAKADLTTKIGLWGAGLVALSAVGVGFGVAVKYVKKLRGAA